jgi:predicted DNA-binding ribbon-helix-helix protein
VVGGHKTSVSLEDDFWDALKEIAREHRVTLSDLVGSLDEQRQHGNLSSALRLFVLNHYRRRVADETERSGARPANGEMQLAKGPD